MGYYILGQLYELQSFLEKEDMVVVVINYYEGSNISSGYKIIRDTDLLGTGQMLYLGEETIILRSAASYGKNKSNKLLATDQCATFDKFLWNGEFVHVRSL